MSRYHVNPATGEPGTCRATVTCPYGDINDDHFGSADEARIAYEEKMGGKILPPPASPGSGSTPIMFPPSKLNEPPKAGPGFEYSLEFDYDYYGCAGSEDEDGICRDAEYEGLRVVGWESKDGVYGYARYTLGLPDGPLPPKLEAALKPYEDITDSVDVWADSGYYGEEIRAELPAGLAEVLADHYYGQPNAVDRPGALAYLRGKGFVTAGLRPLEAIVESVRAEHGSAPAAAAHAKAYKVASIRLSKLTKPSAKRAQAKPQDLVPVKGIGANKPIAGIVFMEADGGYRLLDGYARVASLEAGKRRNGSFIVLRKDPPEDPRRYTSWKSDFSWHS